mgnify:CR=1 FL=1
MEVYKAKLNDTAVFLNPDKFSEFLDNGYQIFKVYDLEDESLDELIYSPGDTIPEIYGVDMNDNSKIKA